MLPIHLGHSLTACSLLSSPWFPFAKGLEAGSCFLSKAYPEERSESFWPTSDLLMSLPTVFDWYASSSNCLDIFFFVVVQSLSHVRLFWTPWTAALQACLSFTVSWSLPKFMSTASVRPSDHLILWCPLLLLPYIFPSIRVFSNESAIRIRWPKYWSFSISASSSPTLCLLYRPALKTLCNHCLGMS